MTQDADLTRFSDDELRAEVRRRGYELHSRQFSEASQRLIRELPELRRRLEALEALARTADPSLSEGAFGSSSAGRPDES